MAAAIKTSPDHSPSTSMSSPESSNVPDAAAAAQKRKGGRKPVYATQEERKMRNRAAQAAFRERRTEYIKHLEATIKQQEETLATLQQSSRSAADEVLMLRYKNSLLERVLLEKRIDVHAELKAFTDSETLPSGSVPSLPPHPPHVQRALNQRVITRPRHQFHNQHISTMPGGLRKLRRLSESSFVSKPGVLNQSPTRKITSPSVSIEMTSPVTSEPASAIGSSTHSFLSRASAPSQPQQHQRRFSQGGELSTLASLYPSNYQSHMDKLEQEYDAEMCDNEEDDDDLQDGHDLPGPLQSSDFGLTPRGQAQPSVSSPDSGSTSAPISGSAGKMQNAASNDTLMQQYYSTGSWTVDLFSDPYMMGPLQFPNPFTTFPTSSMR